MKSIIIFSFVAFLGLVFSSGCKKKNQTTLKIIVRDQSNMLIHGASVHITGQSLYTPSTAIDKTEISDNEGEVIFNFDDIYQDGQTNVADIDIVITKSILYGADSMIVEGKKENLQTVYIQ